MGEERRKQLLLRPSRHLVVHQRSVVARVVDSAVLPEVEGFEVGFEGTEEDTAVEVELVIKVAEVVVVVVGSVVDRADTRTERLLSMHHRVQVEEVVTVEVGLTTAETGTAVVAMVAEAATGEVGIATRIEVEETTTILASDITTATAMTIHVRNGGTRQAAKFVLSVWYVGGYRSSHVFHEFDCRQGNMVIRQHLGLSAAERFQSICDSTSSNYTGQDGIRVVTRPRHRKGSGSGPSRSPLAVLSLSRYRSLRTTRYDANLPRCLDQGSQGRSVVYTRTQPSLYLSYISHPL